MNCVKVALLFLLFFITYCGIPAQAAENPEIPPGIKLYKMGDIKIIAVRDTASEMNRALLLGDKKHIEELMPEEKVAASVNAYLVKTDQSIILIDAGWGQPSGQTLENIKKIGIAPDKIDTVLLTHLHRDHILGLLSNYQVAFPNATLYVSAAEYAYWFNDNEMNKFDDKTRFTITRTAISAYGGKIMTFAPGTEVVPGITAIDLKGHTPGHTGYLIKSKCKQLLVWGDLTHLTEVQLAAPELAVRYDIDPAQAIVTRQTVLAWVDSENIPVAGMHVLFSGIGKIRSLENGGYLFEPLDKLD